MPRALLLLLVVFVGGCVVRRTFEVIPNSPTPKVCPDGAPPKVLQQPDCPDGNCGYTCAPDRWKNEPPPKASQ